MHTLEVDFRGHLLDVEIDDRGGDWIETSIRYRGDLRSILIDFAEQGWGAYDELLRATAAARQDAIDESKVDRYRDAFRSS